MNPDGTRNHPLNGGWAMLAGDTRIVTVSGLLTAARFWPRTGCKTQTGGPATLANPLRCDTGDCWNPTNNGLECAGITGQPPATLFEATLTGLGAANDDTYDVSVVDGYNVGIAVQSVGGSPLAGEWQLGSKYNCGGARCTFNVQQKCPTELRLQAADGSHIAGCSSICTAVKGTLDNPVLNHIRTAVDNRTGYPLENLVCCDCAAGPGVGCESAKCQYGCSPHDTSNPGGKCYAENWPVASNGIPYQDLYKDDCPDSYAWQFADLTSTFHCINADYNVQFCPENAAVAQTVQVAPQTVQVATQTAQATPLLDVTSQVPSVETAKPLSQQPIINQLEQPQSSVVVASSLSTGAIVGTVLGGTAFVLIVATVMAVAFLFRRRRSTKDLSVTQQTI